MTWVPGWDLAAFAEAYARGTTVTAVITSVLAALDAAPGSLLIGEPLRDHALAVAAELDRIGPGDGALFGVPFLVKDNIDIAGAATTAACPGFAYRADRDATVVARLRAAGAVPVGKTNLDQFATGLVGTRSPYGIPPNALRPELVPGGSSSGSAVGVAMGFVPFALGTDTAGSGRVPAAMNGVVGWKPSVGAASTRGIVPAVRRFDCPSVFARSVADAAAVASVIEGFDADEPYSVRIDASSTPMRRLGIVVDWPAAAAPTVAMGEAYAAFVAELGHADVELVGIDVSPLLAAGDLLYGGPFVAERTAAVGGAIEAGVPGLHPVVRDIIGNGAIWSAVDAYRAEYRIAELRRLTEAIFELVDAVVLPTVPGLLTVEEALADPIRANERIGRYTTFGNLLALAAIVVPTAQAVAGVPFAAQLLGPAGSDQALGRLAAALTGERPPAGSASAPERIRLVVVGAHLRGQPLNGQLVGLGAEFVEATTTAPAYRLYALNDQVPPKPGLVHVGAGGSPIAVEVWTMSAEALARLLCTVGFPLALGPLVLADGTSPIGFVAQPAALPGADDITAHGGWVDYLERDRAGRP